MRFIVKKFVFLFVCDQLSPVSTRCSHITIILLLYLANTVKSLTDNILSPFRTHFRFFVVSLP